MVRARVVLSRILYWLGLAIMALGIYTVLVGARPEGTGTTIALGFALGLAGIALTARGATMKRY